MTNEAIIERTIDFVKATLRGAEGGHDWFHIQRVYNTSLQIAEKEEVDMLIVSLGALLHDIADAKFYEGDESIGPNMARQFLQSIPVTEEVIDHVINIIKFVSFKNSLGRAEPIFNSKEMQVIQDADRLDAIGALGIARAFNYGGYKNRPLYDPEIPAQLKLSKEEYKELNSPTINHFYEKLLLLKDQMNTETGQKMAEERHRFMLAYLEQFYKEWEGEL